MTRTWTIDVRLEREQALTDAERARVAAHGRSYVTGWQHAQHLLEPTTDAPVVARGQIAMPLDFASDDPARMLVALTALRRLIPDATCVVEDRHGLVGWHPDGRYELNAGVVAPAPEVAAAAAAPAVEVAAAAAPVGADVYRQPPRPPVDPTPLIDFFGGPVAKVEPALAPGEQRGPEAAADVVAAPTPIAADPALAARVRALPTAKDSWTERRSLESKDPIAVALAVMSVLREVPSSYDVTGALSTALAKVADRTPLRPAMVGLWAEPAPHRDWWRDVARALEPAAADPAVLATVTTIVLADDVDGERRRCAIELLAHAGPAADEALAVLVTRLRRDRDRSRDDARWRDNALQAIGRLGRSEALPTVVLELAADMTVGWYPTLQALARAAGDAALPWLRRAFPCSGAAEYVIDALEYVPGAAGWLHELAASPEPRYRDSAARLLIMRGAAELPWVAAICQSLDGIGHDRRGARERCLEELGQPRGAQDADWDALVRATGATPIALPGFGDVLDGLVAGDDRRGRMLDRVGRDHPEAGLLLPLVLAIELDEALGRRGYRRGSSPDWRRWAQVVPAWRPFAERYGYSADMGDWIRVHRATLAPAVLPPVYQQILDDGADAVAAGWPDPRLLLSPAEAITLDAAERALLATWEAGRGGPAAVTAPAIAAAEPAVLPFDVSELFGVGLERAPARVAPPSRDDAVAILDGSAASEVLAFVPGTTALELEAGDPTMPWLTVIGQLDNRSARPVKLAAMDLALRDEDGRLADVGRRVLRDQFWHHHPLDVRLAFGEGSLDRARTVDVMITHEVSYRARVLAADLEPWDGGGLPARAPWPYRLRPIEPGHPAFDVQLALFRPRADYLRLGFVVELQQRTPLREVTVSEVLVVLRNRGGSVLNKTTYQATIENGGPVYVHGDLMVDLPDLRTARRIEVALSGTTRRTERVASFALPGRG